MGRRGARRSGWSTWSSPRSIATTSPTAGPATSRDTIRADPRDAPGCRVEVLIPDFQGNGARSETVIDAAPRRAQPQHRDGAAPLQGGPSRRPLRAHARALPARAPVRAAPSHEDRASFSGWARSATSCSRPCAICGTPTCNILTLGQYLRPSAQHLPVARCYHPDEFAELGRPAREMGFAHVESGPLVRSSYHAKRQIDGVPAGTGS